MIVVRMGERAFYIPQAAMEGLDEIFQTLEQNMTAMADWETMQLVPDNPD